MGSGAGESRDDGSSSWSAARRLADRALERTLERVTHPDDQTVGPAVRAFVDVMVMEGATPEGTVIALKEMFARAPLLHRFVPLVREQIREAWVSECIDHYFVARGADDLPPRTSEPVRPLREHSDVDDAAGPPRA